MKVFEHSNTTVLTGCTKHPRDQKYCKDHKEEQHPVVSSSKLDPDNRARLRSAKEKTKHYQEQDFSDSVYIIEGVGLVVSVFCLKSFMGQRAYHKYMPSCWNSLQHLI